MGALSSQGESKLRARLSDEWSFSPSEIDALVTLVRESVNVTRDAGLADDCHCQPRVGMADSGGR